MGKIKIKSLDPKKLLITLPKELSYVISKSRTKRIYAGIKEVNHTNTYKIIISNLKPGWYTDAGNYHSTSFYKSAASSSFHPDGVSFQMRMKSNNNDKSFLAFAKQDKRFIMIDTHYSDYTINYFEDNNKFVITAIFKLPESSTTITCDNQLLINHLIDLVKDDIIFDIKSRVNEISKDELFYIHNINAVSAKIEYVTKDKFAYCIYNHLNVNDSKYAREMSFAKFFKEYVPEMDESYITAYIEYNKMLNEYDPGLFSIVNGNDILKYYAHESFYKSSGDLGSSCMKHADKQHLIEFYAKNTNVQLIIMKPKGIDKITGRALLWTLNDGRKVMDRIYTCDSKLISLFHKFANENEFINVYTLREWGSTYTKRNLNSMSPGNWSNNYKENLIVDLNYIPECSRMMSSDNDKYHYSKQARASVNDIESIPYMDNFKYINCITNQASVMLFDNFMTCSYTGVKVSKDDLGFTYEGKCFNQKHVIYTVGDNKLKLKAASRKLFPEIYEAELAGINVEPLPDDEDIVSDIAPETIVATNSDNTITYTLGNYRSSLTTDQLGALMGLTLDLQTQNTITESIDPDEEEEFDEDFDWDEEDEETEEEQEEELDLTEAPIYQQVSDLHNNNNNNNNV